MALKQSKFILSEDRIPRSWYNINADLLVPLAPPLHPGTHQPVGPDDLAPLFPMAPIVKMHTLGHDFVPDSIHAGGLRYHGMSPQVSLLKDEGVIEAQAVHQRKTFEAGVLFARTEGILPAPEPTHAISVVIDEARRAKEEGTSPVIAFNLCGHGHFDLSAYERYLSGSLEDYELPQERIDQALAAAPSI